MTGRADPYYRRDLALVHDRGFAFHAAACAPGILDLLAPVRTSDGLVLELGCGTGLLTKELIAAGHRVIATDASPAMLEVARGVIEGRAEEVRQLTLPYDALPEADAIVAIGHPISYLPDPDAVDRALEAMAGALRPGGLLAIDVCDLDWGEARRSAPNLGRAGPDWAIITEFSMPSPDRFVRDMTTFVPNGDGSWRRDTERLIQKSPGPGHSGWSGAVSGAGRGLLNNLPSITRTCSSTPPASLASSTSTASMHRSSLRSARRRCRRDFEWCSDTGGSDAIPVPREGIDLRDEGIPC